MIPRPRRPSTRRLGRRSWSFEKTWTEPCYISVADSGEGVVEASAVLQYGDRTGEVRLSRRVSVLSSTALERGIEIQAVVMPVAADGGERRGLRRDHIVLGQARHGFTVAGGRSAASFQRVAVGNRLGVDIPVVVTASVVLVPSAWIVL